MKKVLILAILILCGFTANAQFRLGVNVGLPVGELDDWYDASAGIDAYYMLGEPKDFLKFGATAGYLHYIGGETENFGATFEVDDAQFVPLAAAGRIRFLNLLTFGPDFGYAFGINEDNEGGLYWRLVLGIDVGNTIEINLNYLGISLENSTLGSVGLGALISF